MHNLLMPFPYLHTKNCLASQFDLQSKYANQAFVALQFSNKGMVDNFAKDVVVETSTCKS